MIKRLFVYESDSTDPYFNLATEQFLLEHQAPDTCTLYLWQNKNTVVIGKNQNAWKECRTSLLEEEGGRLARRLSGGGAVFHDLGNLNFTFLTSNENYDLPRQLSVIQEACRLAGIETERSGRNDILAKGRKFSGNAFYHNRTQAYHHGTLMVDVDTEKLQRYLSPPKAKLEAKGVDSVRSRVVNLRTLSPGLTCQVLKTYMKEAFRQVYGALPETVTFSESDLAAIRVTAEHICSWDYLYGAPLPFTFECEAYFSWGHIHLQIQARSGLIEKVKIYSDAMDWTLPGTIEEALTGCRFALADMSEVLQARVPQYADDLTDLLKRQQL